MPGIGRHHRRVVGLHVAILPIKRLSHKPNDETNEHTYQPGTDDKPHSNQEQIDND